METPPDAAPSRAGALLTLSTLGAASLSRTSGDGRVEQLRISGKQLALLSILACSPNRAASRDLLVSLLWGAGDGSSSAQRRADDAFRSTLAQLRHKLGESAFGPVGADPIPLALELSCDRDDFLKAVRERNDKQALELYQGHFLTKVRGLDAPPAFEHWVDGVRADLRHEFVVAVRRRAASEAATNSGSPRFESLARQLQAVQEQDEPSWSAILSGLLLSGQQKAAASAATDARTLFRSLELEPTVALRDLMLQAGTPWSSTLDTQARGTDAEANEQISAAPSHPFVGRESELDLCARAWERARAGLSEHVHVASPSGFGKTALLDQLRSTLRTKQGGGAWRKPIVVAATQGTRAIPYRFSATLVEELAAREGALGVDVAHASALVTLAPALRHRYKSATRHTGTLDTLHPRLAAALSALLSAVQGEGPIALLLDDLQWSDEASLRLLADAWSKESGTRALLVTAARTGCESLCAKTRGRTHELAPFDVATIRTLLDRMAPLPSQPWARELPQLFHDVSNGSPQQVHEQLALLQERRLLSATRDGWRTRNSQALLSALEERGATTRRLERLDSEAREILLWLSVAGSPLSSVQLQHASGWTAEELAPRTNLLLARSLIVRDGEVWNLAHDSHAAALLGMTPEESIRNASMTVGRLLAAAIVDGSDDRPLYADHVRQLQHAATMLVTGRDEASIAHAFKHYTTRARATGDPRSNTRLAEELLQSIGTPSSAALPAPALGTKERLIPQLVRSLPWQLRHRVALRRAALASAALLLVATSAGIARWIAASNYVEPLPDAVILASRQSTDGRVTTLQTVPIRSALWTSATPLVLSSTKQPYATIPWSIADTRQTRPDGQAWLISKESADSGGIEVFELSRDGAERRLTRSGGDDLSPAWAPDGTRLVFSTARWNAMAQYDLATYDTLTHEVHQVTAGDDRDVLPYWSPDGSRIAFARELWTGGSAICVVDADGGNVHCVPQSRDRKARLHGWINARELLVDEAVDSTAWKLARMDVATGAEHSIVDDVTKLEAVSLSPDGGWIACRCTSRSKSVLAWWIFPLQAPRDARALSAGEGALDRVVVTWLPVDSVSRVVDRLHIQRGPGPALVNTPYHLRAEGRSRADSVVDVGVVRWRVLDSGGVRVDTSGVVHSLDTGTVRVEASAGGWRRDTITLAVVADTPRTLFEERWDAGLTKSWVTFGDPRPVVVRDSSLGPAFVNNGDRYYFSGAYTADTFTVTGGLWVEAVLSTPIVPNSQWQQQILTLLAGTDNGELARWNHKTGDMTPGDCRVYFPGGDGAHLADTIYIQNPAPAARIAAPAWLRTGRAFRAVVQVFPDGRCGFALDGVPLWISPPAFHATSARAKIDGRSVGTRLLVGTLRVGTGVARQVRWGER